MYHLWQHNTPQRVTLCSGLMAGAYLRLIVGVDHSVRTMNSDLFSSEEKYFRLGSIIWQD